MKSTVRLTAVLSVLVLVFASTATAQEERFDDVPEDHLFHDDVEWMAENRITFGCNPPENTLYCPEDNTTRGQEAAFFHRFAESQAVDAGWFRGHVPDDFVFVEDLNDAIADWVADNRDDLEGEDGRSAAEDITVRSETTEITLTDFEARASCAAGEIAIGGGFQTSGVSGSLVIFGSYPDGNDWVIDGQVVSAGGEITVHVTCMLTP